MRLAVLLAALALSAPAHAFSDGEAMEGVYDLTPACMEGEYGEGTPIKSDKEQVKACQSLVQLQQELSQNGYCYRNNEWARCE